MRPNQMLNPNMNIKVDMNNLDPYLCECESDIFIQGFNIKKVPSLLSPNGQVGIAELSVVKVCYRCGKIYPLQKILNDVKNEELGKPVIIAG